MQTTTPQTLQDLGELYDEYFPKIYKFVFYRIRHQEIAEDITSQTFLKAVDNFKKFNPEKGTFQAWIYRIAQNTLMDHFRRNKQTLNIETVFDLHSDEDISKETSDKFSADQIRDALKILTREQQQIVVMRLWDDLPYQEIATVLAKTEQNCRMIFSRAIAQLRKHVFAMATLILSICIILTSN